MIGQVIAMATRPNEPDVNQADALVREIGDRGPTWRFDGPEFTLWLYNVRNMIRRAYPVEEQSDRLAELDEAGHYPRAPKQSVEGEPDRSKEIAQAEFQANLPRLAAHAEALRRDLSTRGSVADDNHYVEVIPLLRVFIAHGGPSKARDKLETFLRALGSEPLIVEHAAGAAASPSKKVDAQLANCEFGIALATRSGGALQDGELLPRANVIDEMARLPSYVGNRRMLLLETRLSLPSNASDWTYVRFTTQSMDRAFTAIVVELKNHCLLQVRGRAQ